MGRLVKTSTQLKLASAVAPKGATAFFIPPREENAIAE